MIAQDGSSHLLKHRQLSELLISNFRL